MCQSIPSFGSLPAKVAPNREDLVSKPLDGPVDGPLDEPLSSSVYRRLTVAVCWAFARRSVLDSREMYEENFALNEEFREWLLCLEDHPDVLRQHVLMVPPDLSLRLRSEWDGPEDRLLGDGLRGDGLR